VVAIASRGEIPAGIEWSSEPERQSGLSRFPVMFKLSARTACVLALSLLAVHAAPAQKTRGPMPNPAPQAPTSIPDSVPDPFIAISTLEASAAVSGDAGRIVDSEACDSWTESGVHSPTVSATRLAVPGRASSEYQRACGAFKSKKLLEAEKHLRKAIDFYPDYPSAWVVLGQVLESEEKNQQAKAACARAEDLDPEYVASYLCLAEFAANDSDWTDLAKLSAQALALDPIGNPYALYYAADAGLHFNQLTQAEMHAQSAVKLDEWHHLPELHLLLAQIYQAAGNVVGEAVQLREFLKIAANSKDAPRARTILAQLEASPAKVPSGKDPAATDHPSK